MTYETILDLQGLSKAYGDSVAVDHIDLHVRPGEFLTFLGPSGSGKTTTLNLIAGFIEPTSGSMLLNGAPLETMRAHERNLGVVFQDFRLLPNKTVFDNVAFALQVIGKSKGFIQEAVPDVLKMVGLAGKQGRFPHELSGGEQQRVAVARAFVNRPLILLADEPTGNLDPDTSIEIMRLLDRINRTGTTVVMVTHDSNIVNQMRRRVVEIESGHIVRDQARGVYG